MINLIKFILLFSFISSSLFADINFTNEEKAYIKNEKISVAMLPNFPPFSMYENGELSGYSYDILELISKKNGLKIIYEVDIWPKKI